MVWVAETEEQVVGLGEDVDGQHGGEAEPRPQAMKGMSVVTGARVGVGQAGGGRRYRGRPPRTTHPDPQSMESAGRSPFLGAGCRVSGELGPR